MLPGLDFVGKCSPHVFLPSYKLSRTTTFTMPFVRTNVPSSLRAPPISVICGVPKLRAGDECRMVQVDPSNGYASARRSISENAFTQYSPGITYARRKTQAPCVLL